MYCVKESIVTTMDPDMLHKRQELFDKVLPNWENRIFKLAVETYPKVDQRLMGLDDIRQELRIALWEAILSFDSHRNADVPTWVFKILSQATGLIAKLQYHRMPHGKDGHGVQLLPLKNESVVPNDNEQESYEIEAPDLDAIGKIEVGVEKEECVRAIRPAMRVGFEQDVFDLFMNGYTGGEIVRELGLNPKRGGAARVSSVRLKIKIAYAVIHSIPVESVSSAKNAEYLAGRMKHLLSGRKEEAEPEELPPTSMCPQFV